jgi:hypothetical protein
MRSQRPSGLSRGVRRSTLSPFHHLRHVIEPDSGKSTKRWERRDDDRHRAATTACQRPLQDKVALVTKSLAREAVFMLARSGHPVGDGPGLTVNAITPGYVATDMLTSIPEMVMTRSAARYRSAGVFGPADAGLKTLLWSAPRACPGGRSISRPRAVFSGVRMYRHHSGPRDRKTKGSAKCPTA